MRRAGQTRACVCNPFFPRFASGARSAAPCMPFSLLAPAQPTHRSPRCSKLMRDMAAVMSSKSMEASAMATGCGEGRDEKERVSTKKSERAVNCQRVARARAFRGKPTPPGYQEPGGQGGVPPVGTGVCVGGLCRRAWEHARRRAQACRKLEASVTVWTNERTPLSHSPFFRHAAPPASAAFPSPRFAHAGVG